MTNENVVKYIKDNLNKGYSKDQIEQALLSHGYNLNQIQIIFSELESKRNYKKYIKSFLIIVGIFFFMLALGTGYFFYVKDKYDATYENSIKYILGERTCLENNQCDDNNDTTLDYCKMFGRRGCSNIVPEEGTGEMMKEGKSRPGFSLDDFKCTQVFEGNYSNKIPIVFVADGYTNNHSYDSDKIYGIESNFGTPDEPMDRWIGVFDKIVEDELDEEGLGLFGVEPYKSYKEWFDVYSLSSDVILGCSLGQDSEFNEQSIGCDLDLIRATVKYKCGLEEENPFIDVVSGITYLGTGFPNYRSSYSTGMQTHASHELGGHAVAYLGDEYFHPEKIAEDFILGDTNLNLGQNIILISKKIENSGILQNIGTKGCPNWCDGTINTSQPCYPYYEEFKECTVDTPFSECWYNVNSDYFDATGKSFETDCNLGSNCIEETGCYYRGIETVNYYQTANNIMRWHWYGLGYEKPKPDEFVIYTEVELVPEEHIKDVIIDTTTGVNYKELYHIDAGFFDHINNYSWWINEWEHLDVEGCPKWCEGLDTSAACYPYYEEFKECAQNIYNSDAERIGYGHLYYVDVKECWNNAAEKYSLATGKDLADGCILGKNCEGNAQCVWPGGSHFNPYGTFRKNIEFPYWGYGVYSEQILEQKILELTE